MEPKFLPTNTVELTNLFLSESSSEIKKAFKITNENVGLIDNWVIDNLEFLISVSIITDCELVTTKYCVPNPSLEDVRRFDVNDFCTKLDSLDISDWRAARFTFYISNLFLDDQTKFRWHFTYADLKKRFKGHDLHHKIEILQINNTRVLR